MYRITHISDKEETLEATETIDTAIMLARGMSKAVPQSERRMLVVRDGSRIRVVVGYDSRATWVKPCKKCKGTGQMPVVGYFSQMQACDGCGGLGHTDDLPCQ